MMVDALLPALLAGIFLIATLQEVPILSAFAQGVKQGASTLVGILPTLLGMLTAIAMLRACGAIDLFAHLLMPLFGWLGIPEPCVPLALLKPISGGGGLALGSEILQTYGVDSHVGRVTAIMLGASETSVYTIGIYAGSLGVQDTRYLLPAALLADLTVFVCAGWLA